MAEIKGQLLILSEDSSVVLPHIRAYYLGRSDSFYSHEVIRIIVGLDKESVLTINDEPQEIKKLLDNYFSSIPNKVDVLNAKLNNKADFISDMQDEVLKLKSDLKDLLECL